MAVRILSSSMYYVRVKPIHLLCGQFRSTTGPIHHPLKRRRHSPASSLVCEKARGVVVWTHCVLRMYSTDRSLSLCLRSTRMRFLGSAFLPRLWAQNGSGHEHVAYRHLYFASEPSPCHHHVLRTSTQTCWIPAAISSLQSSECSLIRITDHDGSSHLWCITVMIKGSFVAATHTRLPNCSSNWKQ